MAFRSHNLPPPTGPADPDSYVFRDRLRCPKCQGTDLQSYGTRRDKDGSVTRYYRCRKGNCGWPFKLVEE